MEDFGKIIGKIREFSEDDIKKLLNIPDDEFIRNICYTPTNKWEIETGVIVN